MESIALVSYELSVGLDGVGLSLEILFLLFELVHLLLQDIVPDSNLEEFLLLFGYLTDEVLLLERVLEIQTVFLRPPSGILSVELVPDSDELALPVLDTFHEGLSLSSEAIDFQFLEVPWASSERQTTSVSLDRNDGRSPGCLRRNSFVALAMNSSW